MNQPHISLHSPWLYLHFVALTLLVNGCGQSDQDETAPVSGTVTFNGSPLPEGTIIFESDGSRPAYGKIKDGKIVEFTTYQPNDGAPVGSHRVAIQSVQIGGRDASGTEPGDAQGNPAAYMAVTSLIPKKYQNPSTSGLTAEVNAEQENSFEFNLKP